jgi:hypothetical protein
LTFAALLVIAATQASGPGAAKPEPAGAAPVTLAAQGAPETAGGTHSFKKLFTASQDATEKAQLAAQMELQRHALNAQPRVVCGMKLIQADPGIDPKMILRPAPSSTTTFHIRRIPAASCAD